MPPPLLSPPPLGVSGSSATIGIKYSKQFALNKQAQKVKYVATDIVAEEPETPSGGGDNNGGNGNPPSGELEG